MVESGAAISVAAHGDCRAPSIRRRAIYQRYGARLTRTIALRPSVSSRLEMSWMDGPRPRSLQPVRLRQRSTIRFTGIRPRRSAMTEARSSEVQRRGRRHGVRVDAFARRRATCTIPVGLRRRARIQALAWVSNRAVRFGRCCRWSGATASVHRDTDGGRGTQTARITVYRGLLSRCRIGRSDAEARAVSSCRRPASRLA